MVEAGEPKGLQYASLSLSERLRAFASLNARVWRAAGYVWPSHTSRSEWPGEIFQIRG